MKTKILTLLFIGGSVVLAAPAIGVGIEIGAPPRPPRVHYVRPAAPGPNFVWINGYYEPAGRDYRWREGYWAPRPYPHAVWVAPRYTGHRYYRGYWRR